MIASTTSDVVTLLLVCLLAVPIYFVGEGMRRRIVRRRRERR